MFFQRGVSTRDMANGPATHCNEGRTLARVFGKAFAEAVARAFNHFVFSWRNSIVTFFSRRFPLICLLGVPFLITSPAARAESPEAKKRAFIERLARRAGSSEPMSIERRSTPAGMRRTKLNP